MGVYVIAAIILAVYVILAWAAGALLQFSGAKLWVVRGVLIFIGTVAVAVFLWFHHRMKKGKRVAPLQPTGETAQIKLLIQRAAQRLKQAGHGRLSRLPIIFVLGRPNSAKTSVVLNCGLEPELLAGDVQHDGDVISTAAINIWLARKTIIIEPGGTAGADLETWRSVLQLTRPSRLAAAIGGRQSPRAAVVCCSCESLQSAQQTGRELTNQLKELAASLGAAFPVYVLFTKADQVPNFAEFTANLITEEARQVVGTTTPIVSMEGVFAEREGSRLKHAFDQIVYSLAERRLDLLARESSPDRKPGIYEFPREIAKIRDLAIQFLVELTRPTQLTANPFLRGFYFCGVRSIIVNEAVALVPIQRVSAVSVSGARSTYSFADTAATAPAQTVKKVQSRKALEWTFLSHFFDEIVLQDRAGFSASRQSRKVDALRRGLAAAVIVMGLCCVLVVTMSYFRNRLLAHEIEDPATELAKTAQDVVDLPTEAQLRELDQLRSSLLKLESYDRDGAPLSHQFGLYVGRRLEPTARKAYFEYFRRLLLASTKMKLTASLKSLPDNPSPSDDYAESYKSLKAYLICTSRHDQSTEEFLAPVLLSRWAAGGNIDPERRELAATQFGFYSNTLKQDATVSDSDSVAIEHARHYLNQFTGTERIYQAMLTEAGKNNPSINLDALYPGLAKVITNTYQVPGAFTRNGYLAMKVALQSPERFFGGEEWVLGPQQAIPSSSLGADLERRYEQEFIKHWAAFLSATVVSKYSSNQDAAKKLQILAGNASPLLHIFSLVEQNTNVDSRVIADEFQPVKTVAGSPSQLIDSANQPYMGALSALQANFAGLAAVSPDRASDPSSTAPITQTATSGREVVNQIVQKFRSDGRAHVDIQTHKLLEAPIAAAEQLVRATVPGNLNAAGKSFCSQFSSIASKYPFNTKAGEEATLEDLKFFQPGSGFLWTFYEANLKNVLARQGKSFSPVPGSTVQVSAQFISFLNRAAMISDTLFTAGSASPHLTYSLSQPRNKSVEKSVLSIDGKSLSKVNQVQQFEWPGDPKSAGETLTVTYAGGTKHVFPSHPGRWGAFRFFQKARWTPGSNGSQVLEWRLESEGDPIQLPDGSNAVIRYEIQGSGVQLFQQGMFEGLHCPSLGAH